MNIAPEPIVADAAAPAAIGTTRLLGTTTLLAVRAIRRHLLRSFLTTLGIVIGVAAVVTMVTLGRGAGGPPPQPFKPEDVDAIRNQIAGLTSIAPQAQTSATVVHNSANWSTTLNGTTDDYLTGNQWAVTQGRMFTPAEEQAGKAVCILGTTVVTNIFPEGRPVGQRFRVGNVSCEAIGVLATRGQQGFGGDQDDTVIMPIKAVQRRFNGNQDIRAIMVGYDPRYDSQGIQDGIAALLRERRGITGDKQDDFNIFDTKQISDTLQGTTKVLTALLGAVAAVSLIVGGIGIMNIMLVSVTERTREIGIRLAIGAVGREVMLQFLVEAVALSCLGGVTGIVLALVATIALAPLLQVPWLFDLRINLLAFFFSALIGVVFGYFPARRAAALNPIDALRHE